MKNFSCAFPARALSCRCVQFTMVELLVVIAVIIILVAILLPALHSAKESGNRISCSSNLRNLCVAEMQYVNDFNERFTPNYPGVDEDGSTHFYWTNLLYPYVGGIGTSKKVFRRNVNPENSVFFCKSQRPFEVKSGGDTWPCTNDYPSYGLNASLGGREVTPPKSARLSAVKNMSSVVMFADTQFALDRPHLGFRHLTSAYFSARHPSGENGRMNFSWVDGHVSSELKSWATANELKILDYYNFTSNWF